MSDTDTQTDKILVVDDDKALRELLKRYLSENGYEPLVVKDGIEMQALLVQTTPDLIILDLMLPGDDGLTLARQIRSKSNTPIIILSVRGEEIDRIVGLEIGADDYLPMPFNPRELLTRIRSVLRRSQSSHENTDINAQGMNVERLLKLAYRLRNEAAAPETWSL